MNEATTPRSISADECSADSDWPGFPTETDIYILPNGEVIFADLPAELDDLAQTLGLVQPCAVEPDRWQRNDS